MFRVVIYGFFIWILVTECNAARERNYLKCDQHCLNSHQYPKVTGFICKCEGQGRMPDDYLKRK